MKHIFKIKTFMCATLLLAIALQVQAQCSNVSHAANTVGVGGLYNTAYSCDALRVVTGQGNIGIGYSSGWSLTSGTGNSFAGAYTFGFNATGNYNTGIGLSVLSNGNANFSNCTGVGVAALQLNTANENTAVGWEASGSNVTGTPNDAFGYEAQLYDDAGVQNVSIGYQVHLRKNGGSYNTCIGTAIQSNIPTLYSCSGNTAAGSYAMYSSTAGYNSAAGYRVLYSNTTGGYNTALGAEAMYNTTTGTNNVGIGYQALRAGTTATGNVGIGYQAAKAFTTATGITAVGTSALNVGTGGPNDAFGYRALYSVTLGNSNVAVGTSTLYNNTGSYNTAVGGQCLYSNTSGLKNTGAGMNCLFSNTTGDDNTAIGYQAMFTNVSSFNNTAFGSQALYWTTGGANTAFGRQASANNSTGTGNCAMGQLALGQQTTGSSNTAFGMYALQNESTHSNNTALGYNAGGLYTSYTNCTFLGINADANASGRTNAMALGNGAIVNADNKIRLGNAAITAVYGAPATYSDARFKTDVKEEVAGIEFIKRLRPVVYNLEAKKLDAFLMKNMPAKEREARLAMNDYGPATAIRQSGFIAQEVEQAAKEVNYDFSGLHKPVDEGDNYGLSYELFVVPLVKGMQEQAATVEQQNQDIADAASELDMLTLELEYLKDCCDSRTKAAGVKAPEQLNSALLFNAVPNPTANSSVISFFVPMNFNSARIEIADKEGMVIQKYSAGNGGYTSVTVQTGDLAAGVYLYSLIVDSKVIATKKLSVVH